MGKLGWIAAFVYVAGAALRLARFNTMLDVADKRWFTGMPSPAAAALVAGIVWIVDDYNIDPAALKWWALVGHRLRRPHDGQQRSATTASSRSISKSVPFLAIFVFVLAIALLSYQPALVLFAGFVVYALSGYVGLGVDSRCGAGAIPSRLRRA